MSQPKLEPLKRKLRSQTANAYSLSSDKESLFYLVSFDLEQNKYGIINEDEIKIDEKDKSKGVVKDKGRCFPVTILRKGYNIKTLNNVE